MKYFFKFFIGKEKSKLVLLQEEKEVAVCEWREGRDMGRRLFEGMVGLLKEHDLKPMDVSGFVVDSDVPEGYTSMRIAETVKRVYASGVSHSRSNEK